MRLNALASWDPAAQAPEAPDSDDAPGDAPAAEPQGDESFAARSRRRRRSGRAPVHAHRGAAPGPKRQVRALVLTPTRELCVQNEESFRAYGKYLDLRFLAVYGGVRIDRQLKKLHNGVDIVIATPGRLLDHMQRHTIDLRAVDFLVLDEVDRMFDMGFIQDVRKIMSRFRKSARRCSSPRRSPRK